MALVQIANKEWHGIKDLDKKEDLLRNFDRNSVGTIYVEIDSTGGITDVFELNCDYRGVVTWYKL